MKEGDFTEREPKTLIVVDVACKAASLASMQAPQIPHPITCSPTLSFETNSRVLSNTADFSGGSGV